MEFFFAPNYMGYVAAGVVEVVLLIQWSLRRDRKSAVLLLVGPGIVGVLVGLDVLVKTPRERIESTVEAAVERAEVEDAEGVIALMSDSFEHKGYVRKVAASAVVRNLLRGEVIESNTISSLEIFEANKAGGGANMALLTIFDPDGRLAYGGLQKTRWRMAFVRDQDGVYRLSDLELLSVGEERGFDIWSGRIPTGF